MRTYLFDLEMTYNRHQEAQPVLLADSEHVEDWRQSAAGRGLLQERLSHLHCKCPAALCAGKVAEARAVLGQRARLSHQACLDDLGFCDSEYGISHSNLLGEQ